MRRFSDREEGFYWVSVEGRKPVIAEWVRFFNSAEWRFCGVEFGMKEDLVQPVSGRILPPST